jgi:acyl dehydratase
MYLEDLALGQILPCGRFSLTEAEIIDFASRYDPQPWHLDDALARETYFAGLCASGVHTQAVSIGLVVRAIAGVRIVAGGALNEARFLVPVRPNRDYDVTAAWRSARPSARNPARGVAVLDITTADPNGGVVMQAGITFILARRPEATA